MTLASKPPAPDAVPPPRTGKLLLTAKPSVEVPPNNYCEIFRIDNAVDLY